MIRTTKLHAIIFYATMSNIELVLSPCDMYHYIMQQICIVYGSLKLTYFHRIVQEFYFKESSLIICRSI